MTLLSFSPSPRHHPKRTLSNEWYLWQHIGGNFPTMRMRKLAFKSLLFLLLKVSILQCCWLNYRYIFIKLIHIIVINLIYLYVLELFTKHGFHTNKLSSSEIILLFIIFQMLASCHPWYFFSLTLSRPGIWLPLLYGLGGNTPPPHYIPNLLSQALENWKECPLGPKLQTTPADYIQSPA